MKMVTGGSCLLLLALTTHGHALKASSSCESLSSLALPNTSITLAQVVPAGAFTLPGTGPAAPQFSQLPTFCRVAATLTPSVDSDIKIEVWLPAADWNGEFQAVGNGGWAGTISYGAPASALQEGYATASTDTGHAGANASFAIGHPEKGHRFRLSSRPRDGSEIKSYHCNVLRSRATVFVLDGLLHWGAAGPDGGSALPGRFRWDYRRRSCE